MTEAGWSVERSQAEVVRQRLREQQLLRTDRRVRHEPERVVFPLTGAPRSAIGPGELVFREFEPLAAPPSQSYRDLLQLPNELQALLPRSFDVVGDVVLIRLPEALLPHAPAIGEALLHFVPGARLVGRDAGVHGPERRRSIERIAGTGDWTTRCRENGLALEVDLERAYFSPRLAREHQRVARSVPPGARAFDLCCGIGPFALTIAHVGRAREVLAVDSNPAAIELLERNARRLRLDGKIRAIGADVGEFLEHAGVAGYAVMNLPFEGIKYLTSVGKSMEAGGVLDYFEVTDRADQPGRPSALVDRLGGPREYSVSAHRVVHPYSPSADLVAYTFARRSA